MPTYEYLCTECGITFDVFQAMSDSVLDRCPKCGGKVRRLVSGGSGLIFKGSGFYVTDYKNKSVKEISEPVSKKPSKSSTSEISKE